MNLELGVLILLALISTLLVFRNFYFFVYILLVTSVLLHKELFSFYMWDFMPIRMTMVAISGYFIYIFLNWSYIHLKTKTFLSNLYLKLADPFILLFTLVLVSRYVSLINTLNIKESLELTAFFTLVYVLSIGMYIRLQFEALRVERYLNFYALLSLFLSIFGYIQIYLYYRYQVVIGAFWSIPNNLPRVGSIFWDVNHFGAFLSLIMPYIGVSALVSPKWRDRIFFGLVFLLNSGILLMTNSRSAWILGGVALLVFVTATLVRKFGSKGLLYIVISIALVTVPLIAEYSNKASPFRAKIRNYFNYRIDSFDSHFLLLSGAFEVFEEHPIIGGGYGGFFDHFRNTKIAPEYFSRDPAGLTQRVPAHTIWGENLADTGILGFSLYLMLFMLVVGYIIAAAFSSSTFEYFAKNLSLASALTGVVLAGVFYSYNTEFFWILITMYFLYSVTHNGFTQNSLSNKYTSALQYLGSSKILPILLIFFVSLSLIFISLGSNHLIVWDEAIYAKISSNMVETGNYLTMSWRDGSSWYEKPPLYMWLSALLIDMFGFSSLAVRFPSAFFGLLTVLVVYQLSSKMFDRKVGVISSLALVTTTHFLYYTRSSMLDVTATFFITLAIYLYYLFSRSFELRYKWFFVFLSGLSLGLAVMTKGIVGIVPVGGFVLYELISLLTSPKNYKYINLLGILVLLISVVLVAFPWHYYMYLQFGDTFVNNYLGYHVIDRAFTSIEDKGRPFLWYVEVMKVSMRLWFIVLLAALPLSLLHSFVRKNRNHILILSVSVVLFVVFSLSVSKLIWYIIPIYPLLSILVGYCVVRFYNLLTVLLPKLNNIYAKFIYYFVIVTGSLFYLYFNKELVYMGDLTGNKAKALIYAAKNYPNKEFVVDSTIEEPLILLYLSKPYLSFEYKDLKKYIMESSTDDEVVFITKESRFRDINTVVPNIVLVDAESEWVVGILEQKDNKNIDQ